MPSSRRTTRITDPATTTQLAVLRAYADRLGRGMPAPTYRELLKRFGWSSTNAVADPVRALVRRGLLARRNRTVFLTASGWEALGLEAPKIRRVS